jgi:hypothetical protein
MTYIEIIVGLGEALLLAVLARSVVLPSQAAPGPLRARAGAVMVAIATFIFFMSGVTKLMRAPFAVDEMGLLRLTGWKYDLVAAVEITSGVLFVVKPLRSVALLFAAAHCGGAICAHLIAGQYFAMIPSAMVLTLATLGSVLRYPQILWSLRDYGQAHPLGIVGPRTRAADA